MFEDNLCPGYKYQSKMCAMLFVGIMSYLSIVLVDFHKSSRSNFYNTKKLDVCPSVLQFVCLFIKISVTTETIGLYSYIIFLWLF